MIRISKIIPQTLTWRLILTSVSVLMAVQLIIIVVFVLDMRQNFAENAHRMTLLRLISSVRVLDHNDPKIYHEFIKTRLTHGLFANISTNPVIPENRNEDYENKIKKELDDSDREIYIQTFTKFDVNTENLNIPEEGSLKNFRYVASNRKNKVPSTDPANNQTDTQVKELTDTLHPTQMENMNNVISGTDNDNSTSHQMNGWRDISQMPVGMGPHGFPPPPPPPGAMRGMFGFPPPPPHHGRMHHHHDRHFMPGTFQVVPHKHDMESKISTIENNNPFDNKVLPKDAPLDTQVSLYGSIKLKSGYYFTFACYENNTLIPHLSSLTVLAISFATIIGTLLFFLLFTELTRPLKLLMRQAEKLSSDYKTPPLETKGPKEIQDLQRSFNRMQEHLASFIDDRTRILASISHDLKTPLTSLRLRTEFLEENEDTVKLRETIDTMTEMVKATLLFARGDENTDESREIHLPSLLESICNNYTDAGRDISYEESGKFKRVNNFFCSSMDIHRILQNLIDNAFQYGTKVRVRLEETNEQISISVCDNGPGIPEEKLDEVFAPFMRLDEARNTQEGHVGLGLSIVRNIILKQGGKIHLQNAHPHGLEAVITYTIHNS